MSSLCAVLLHMKITGKGSASFVEAVLRVIMVFSFHSPFVVSCENHRFIGPPLSDVAV